MTCVCVCVCVCMSPCVCSWNAYSIPLPAAQVDPELCRICHWLCCYLTVLMLHSTSGIFASVQLWVCVFGLNQFICDLPDVRTAFTEISHSWLCSKKWSWSICQIGTTLVNTISCRYREPCQWLKWDLIFLDCSCKWNCRISWVVISVSSLEFSRQCSQYPFLLIVVWQMLEINSLLSFQYIIAHWEFWKLPLSPIRN